jgi:septal ring factor EnvC (AmiA/AmiB activator)
LAQVWLKRPNKYHPRFATTAMAARALLLLALVAAPLHAAASASNSNAEVGANPIRKVVTMLQTMQKKVEEEGKKEQDLYDKFMCYCKTNGGDLDGAIAAAETKIPQLGSDIKAAEEKKTQTEEDLKQAQTDRASAKEAIASATAIREKEAAAYAAEKAEYTANIAALGKAIAALEKGMAGSFLQTTTAQTLKKIALGSESMLDADRQELLAFLSGTQKSEYAPQSGEITGILKTLHDEMSKSLADATAAEKEGIASFEALLSAKNKEIAALSESIETKSAQIGELGVSIAMMKNDLTDTEEALIADQKFKAELATSCETKTAEWEEIKKTRSEELVALSETIKILNDDDALDLFKKTLPSASSSSFVQVKTSNAALRAKALSILQAVHRPVDSLDFIALALHSKKIGFEKVIKMIDEMVVTLKKEQQDDEDKKEYCSKQLDQTEDKKKELEQEIADQETAIATAEETISTLAEEIKALKAGIKSLDKEVAAATEQRKEEHEDFTELMASDSAAKELLNFAKNRLNKFYNPKLYVAPKKAAEEFAQVHASAVSFAQIQAHVQKANKDAPPPPPEAPGPYEKKGEESTGVIAMIDLLIKDLDKEMTEAETAEKDAQADYAGTMQRSAEKRTKDSKLLTEKSVGKADTEAALEAHKESKEATGKELMGTESYMASLHAECDWLLKYFDMRAEARSSEIDALGKAKAVLSGADYAFLQTKQAGFLARA